jgi:hypothetical protein
MSDSTSNKGGSGQKYSDTSTGKALRIVLPFSIIAVLALIAYVLLLKPEISHCGKVPNILVGFMRNAVNTPEIGDAWVLQVQEDTDPKMIGLPSDYGPLTYSAYPDFAINNVAVAGKRNGIEYKIVFTANYPKRSWFYSLSKITVENDGNFVCAWAKPNPVSVTVLFALWIVVIFLITVLAWVMVDDIIIRKQGWYKN